MKIHRFKSTYVEIEFNDEEWDKREKFYNDNPGFRATYAGPKMLDFPKVDPKIKVIKGYITEEIGTEEIV